MRFSFKDLLGKVMLLKPGFSKDQRIKIFQCIVIGILISIGTFPGGDWSFSVGIDSPLAWVFNHFYEQDMSLGQHIVFPHGPLAFLMYPLQNNVVNQVIVLLLLKIVLVINVFSLVEKKNKLRWLLTIAVSFLIAVIAGFNHLVLANVLFLFCNYYSHKNRYYKLLAFLLVGLLFYVKAYGAILSGLFFFSFVVYYFFFIHKNIKKVLVDVALFIGIILLIWFCMYGNFNHFIQYMIGVLNLAQDNSSAAAIYPDNNWFLLVPFLLILFLLPFFSRDKKSVFYGFITSLSLFAAWKHGMAREDLYHMYGFLVFATISFVVFALFVNRYLYRNLIFAGIAILLLSAHINYSVGANPLRYDLFKAQNFLEFAMDFNKKSELAKQISGNNIASQKLPEHIVESIGEASVDIYPWDYSIIAANDLNYQPRTVIHSYASYTHWLDKKNATHFNSDQAPEFLIWEIKSIGNAWNQCDFNSIDYRYLLNDEPLTMIQFLSNYKHFYRDDRFLILKKRDENLNYETRIIASDHSVWGEWIKVPDIQCLLRAKLEFDKSFIQRLKSFFYKDEQCWVFLKQDNGIIHKYRIVPKNANDGVWINPYIQDFKGLNYVEEIMFMCSNQKILSDDLTVHWEQFNFEEQTDIVSDFFSLENKQDTTILISENGFEEGENNQWTVIADSLYTEDAFKGEKAAILNPASFSSAFEFSLDSIPFGMYKIDLNAWIKSENANLNDILVVISVADTNNAVLWDAVEVKNQIFDKNQWDNVYNYEDYNHDRSNCILKGYVLNNNKESVLVDDLNITIRKIDSDE